jgi:hypothetical protein
VNKLGLVSPCFNYRSLDRTHRVLDSRCNRGTDVSSRARNCARKCQSSPSSHASPISISHYLFQSNILVTSSLRTVLTDYGLSKTRSEMLHTRLSSASAPNTAALIEGPKNWMAPERMTGSRLRKEADIYGFGMTLFEVRFVRFPLSISSYHTRFMRMKPLSHLSL